MEFQKEIKLKGSETEQAKGRLGGKIQFSAVHLSLLKEMCFTCACGAGRQWYFSLQDPGLIVPSS